MSINTRILRCSLLLLAASMVMPARAEEKAPPMITFDDDVKPILQQKCFSCHNPDKKSSDLDLTTYTNLMSGGAAGSSIESGDASASYLYSLVTHADEPAMPPESPKLPDEMLETIRKWIDGGVLENLGSTAKASKKKKFDMALSTPATEKPAVVPMPARLSLQPLIRATANTAIDALATSPWAPLAAVGGQKQVLLYNTQTLDLVGVLPFPEGTPRVIKFSRNGSLVLAGGGVGGASGRVVVWNIRSGERIIEIGSELDEILAADISSDQSLVALGGPLKVVRIYSTESGQLLHEIRKHTDWITSLEFSPDSVLLASGDRNGGLFVWEGWTGREYLTLSGHTASINDVSWRSDSSILASGSEDTTIRLWEMENGGQVKNWGAHGGGVSSLEFTRDGRLVSCGRDNTPKLWDQNGGQQRAFEAFADVGLNVSYCDETNRVIAGDWTGEVRVWNSADGARVGGLAMNAPTLQERLDGANQTLVTRQSEFNASAEAYQVAQTQFDKIKTDLAAAEKVAADAKQRAETAATTLVTVKKTMVSTVASRDAANLQLQSINTSLPLLKEAAEKAIAAAANVSDDAELVAAAQKFKSVADAKSVQQQALTQATTEMSASLEKLQAELVATEKLATESVTALAAADQQVQQLMPMLKPAEDAAATTKQSADQATAALESAKQQLARWTDEIAFTQKLDELTTQLTLASQTLAEREAEHSDKEAFANEAAGQMSKANGDLMAAQAELEKNASDYASAVAATETAKQVQATATQMLATANASVVALGQVVSALIESTASAEKAAAVAKEDASVSGGVDMLKSLVAEKTKQLEAAKVDVTAKAQAEQDAKANVANSGKLATDTLAAQSPIMKRIAELGAATTVMQASSQAAKQATDTTAKAVAEAQQIVDSTKQAIAQTQGL